ncbi:hypothetical protein EAF04_002735 [Stromatinia cepivora]|nr:hypothetical protein EAF04_002735 [Stromatinia cepivora]
MMNTSINITIASIHGHQQVIQHSMQYQNTVHFSSDEDQGLSIPNSIDDDRQMYSAYFSTLGNMLFGNIFINQVQTKSSYPSSPAGYYMIDNITNDNPSINLFCSCDDIQTSPFKYYINSDNNETTNVEVFEVYFPSDSWHCRNRTLLRAIEDLSINITIGYLSSPNLTNNNTEFRNITTSDTRNIYAYHPLYLILSYSIGFLFASLSGIIGLYSTYVNGVSHSNSFSTIMLTTRNADLDILARGKSLGSDPLPKSIKKTRLRFGPLVSKQGLEKTGPDGFLRHVAFGLEGSVGELKKGGKYI